MTGPCTRDCRDQPVGSQCPGCGHHSAVHPGVNSTLAHCAVCELVAVTDAARDQENWLAAQAEELAALLDELRVERDALRALRAPQDNPAARVAQPRTRTPQ